MIIKALSVKLPWAEMIMNGQKRIEFRTWKTSYRGPLLIVASAKPNIPAPGSENTKLSGKSLCVVQLVACRVTTNADRGEPGFPRHWDSSKKTWWSWILSSRYLVNRIPIKGRLGIYNYNIIDDSIVEAWEEATKYFMNPPF